MSIPNNNHGPLHAGPLPPKNNNSPPPVATDFGLRHHMIQQVQKSCQFYGLPGNDANRHIDKFLEITQYMKQNGVSDDALRLYLFLYSLTHHATAWYDRLLRNSIHTFDDMMRKLFSKYFPPSMERYMLSIDRCPNHNMLLVTQSDTFYNGLTLRHRDTINAATRGTFMQKTLEECYDLIENMTTHHNHWDTSSTRDETSRTISSTTTTESLEEMRELWWSHSYTQCPAIGSYTQEASYATTGNHNSRGNSYQPGVAYDGPTIPPTPSSLLKEVECETEATKDKTNLKPSIPYPLRLNNQKLYEKANNQMLKFLQIFQRSHFDIRFADALLHMLKFASTFKSLLSNKEKLFKLACTPLNKNCSAVLLKKLPKKLGDPGKFLIPCDFSMLEECLALAVLSASINLVPFSVLKKRSLLELTLNRMTLELTNQFVAIPVSFTEDAFVKVGKFYFPADFVIVDYDVDPWVPLILRGPFLRTKRALIYVHGEELTLRVNDEVITFKAGHTSSYSRNYYEESVNRIDVIDIHVRSMLKKCSDFFIVQRVGILLLWILSLFLLPPRSLLLKEAISFWKRYKLFYLLRM
nr:reverse transcriptase domain-containing protein [Tanacetum cinerariifolium]